ncbi:hypothetical protein DFJ73DRAFT_776654 [Zopfochytrium polystomum]|nr:hypothetical protein DFJ73DRAFT_776654 [Zopfochytrium polystomum]
MLVAAAPTSVIPAAVPTAVNAPSTTLMDVDHNATPVAEISPNRVITGDLERIVLNTKLQGIEEFKALARPAPATTEVFARTFTPALTPASLIPAAATPSTPVELDTVMVDTPASLPDRPVNTLPEVAQLNDMQWARFFNDMGTPTPEEIALSSVYSVPGNNALINAFSDIFEGSASSPVTPTALAAAAAAAAVATVHPLLPVLTLRQPQLQLPALPLPVLMPPALKLLKLLPAKLLPIDLLNVLPRRLNKLQLPMRLASVALLTPPAAPDLLPEKLRLLGLKNTTNVLPQWPHPLLLEFQLRTLPVPLDPH